MVEIFFLFLLVVVTSAKKNSDKELEFQEKAEALHRKDSESLIVFLFLLFLTVLTIWALRRLRIRFVHETGLSLIYGMIVGAIIKFFYGPDSEIKNNAYSIVDRHTDFSKSPEAIIFITNSSNHTFYLSDDPVYPPTNMRDKMVFDPEIFFNIFLPPIIFYGGYSLKRLHFFKNFGSILLYAFIGTIISCFVVGGVVYGLCSLDPSIDFSFIDCLFFGAVISATDPVTVLALFHDLGVDVDLFALVFGESALNDAVAIVLSQSVETMAGDESGGFGYIQFLNAFGNFVTIFVGSFLLGVVVAFVTALVTKFTRIRDNPLLETSMFVILTYMAFLIAEALEFTGIVAMLFCGVTQAHYTFHNLSEESRTRISDIGELISFLAENFIFSYMGLAMFTISTHHWNMTFIGASFLGILIGRICNIYPLSFILNLGRDEKISFAFQHLLTFAGLRGAIAFALAIRNTSTDQRKAMLTTTLFIVFVTVICCGSLTTQVLEWLNIRVGVDDEIYEERFQAVSTSVDATASDEQRYRRLNYMVQKWLNIDNHFLKPIFTNKGASLHKTLPSCCSCIADILSRQPAEAHKDSDPELILNEIHGDVEIHSDAMQSTGFSNGRDQQGSSSLANDVASGGDLGLGNPALCTKIET